MEKNGRRLTQSPKNHFANRLTDGFVSRKKLTFSFEYFEQREFFGLQGQNNKWFVSLLDRLKDLSAKSPEELLNPKFANAYRYHPIDWQANAIPVKIDELTLVPDYCKNNPQEFPLCQFQMSTGTGRVIGFFGEDSTIFYIVLLDPKHNMQPSKKYSYKVDKTSICSSQYDDLKAKLIKTCPSYAFDQIFFEDSQCLVWLDKELADVLVKSDNDNHEILVERLESFLLNGL